MIYVLTDDYGNEIGAKTKDLAEEILASGCNPFNKIMEVESYDDLIVESYDEFCRAFY